MTTEEIAEAVESGAKGQPKPVAIGFAMTVAGRVATLYTPRTRVQLVAKASQLAYKPVSPADITPEVCQNLTLVAAAPWQRHSVVTVVLLPKGSADPAQAIHPTWVRPYTVAAPAVFGTLGLGFGNAVLAQTFTLAPDQILEGIVASFPPDAFSAGRELVFVYDGRFNKPRGFGRTNELRFEVKADWR